MSYSKHLKYFEILFMLRYLAHMYMAEAQVALDQIADAIQHLNPDDIADVTTDFPEAKQDQQGGW